MEDEAGWMEEGDEGKINPKDERETPRLVVFGLDMRLRSLASNKWPSSRLLLLETL